MKKDDIIAGVIFGTILMAGCVVGFFGYLKMNDIPINRVISKTSGGIGVSSNAENQAFIDEVQGSMNKSLKTLEEVMGHGGCRCYTEDNMIYLDYWVDNTEPILAAHLSGYKVNGLSHYDALTMIGETASYYYNVREKYGVSKDTGFTVSLLNNGDKNKILAFWVNGILGGDSVKGYTYSK